METCLKTKLKVEVNNPNLPILETMQQFTLDAITRGGNMTMTDEQKWALNHFFYQIGAISNNGLWLKIRTLLLPIIGNEKAKLGEDYRTSYKVLTITSQYVVDQIGALAVNFGGSYNTTSISFSTGKAGGTVNIKDSTLIVACTKTSVFNVAQSAIAFKHIGSSGNLMRKVAGYSNAAMEVGITDGTNSSNKRFASDATPVIALHRGLSDAQNGLGCNADDSIISTTTNTYGQYSNVTGSIEETSLELFLGPNINYGIIIDFNSALSDEEATKAMNAVSDLRKAFLSI